MHRLVKDIDVLDEFVLRLISPWIMAIGAVILVAGVTLLLLPKAWFGLVPIGLAILIAAFVVYRGIHLAYDESTILETRKSKLLDTLPALTSLLIWHRWDAYIHQLSDLDAQQTKNNTVITSSTQNGHVGGCKWHWHWRRHLCFGV